MRLLYNSNADLNTVVIDGENRNSGRYHGECALFEKRADIYLALHLRDLFFFFFFN